ncbi:hypothetical protein [Rhodococcus sp. A5(2022)]|uniref:hypothetical protein n=1 Tax=Rhodococcus sp. A5(2022) TaxID=3003588 RepID=UPI0022A84A7E|nr:hypothetical protein [Rhodococcus sp. A5(2022)]MCZ1075267.1 hypothetical protein [Rhodococcus sp. A5(2022)]
MVLTATITASGIGAGAQVAVAAPVHHRTPAAAPLIWQGVKVFVSWWVLETASNEIVGPVNEKIKEGFQKITVSGPTPEEAARTFVANIPSVSASRVTTPFSLVTLAQHAPGGVSTRVAYVRGKPQELFAKITSGGVRINKNEYKIGVEKVTFKPGTASTPPSITISDSMTSTKVIVLA